MTLQRQKDLIHSTKWDILIVLDACRYDYFKELNWIKGKLSCVRSPAPHTFFWFKATWPKKYDAVYFSANPLINSKGIPSPELGNLNAHKHFRRVIDVWKSGWNEELGTVPPWEVNKAVESYYNYDSRKVIHYMQPHGPWIGKPRMSMFYELEAFLRNGFMADAYLTHPKPKKEKMEAAYRGNLKLVLRYVDVLINNFPDKKIIITSDHGELLGEGGYYLHKFGFPDWLNDYLLNVPWLEVEV